MNENKNKKNITILSLIIICAIIIGILGATYAYFTINVDNTSNTDTSISSAKIDVSYSDGAKVEVSNIIPGWTSSKTISITNNSSVEVSYTINWTNVSNNFVIGTVSGEEEFVYYVTKSTTNPNSTVTTGTKSAAQTMPRVDGSLFNASNVSIAPGATDTYVIDFEYINNENGNQTENMNKTFTSTLQASLSNITGLNMNNN